MTPTNKQMKTLKEQVLKEFREKFVLDSVFGKVLVTKKGDLSDKNEDKLVYEIEQFLSSTIDKIEEEAGRRTKKKISSELSEILAVFRDSDTKEPIRRKLAEYFLKSKTKNE